MQEKKFEKKEPSKLWHPNTYIKSVSSSEVEKLKKTIDKEHDEDMDFNCKKCNKKISAHNKDWHESMCDKCFNETYFPEKTKEKAKEKKRIFMKPGKNNKEDRINFVKFWANYIKTHKDEEWSEQQNIIVNSQIHWEE